MESLDFFRRFLENIVVEQCEDEFAWNDFPLINEPSIDEKSHSIRMFLFFLH